MSSDERNENISTTSGLCKCGGCKHSTLISMLYPGLCFRGRQTVSQSGLRRHSWGVRVCIEHVDTCKGTISGSMEAYDAPATTQQEVLTYWEGEIVDGVNNSFVTRKWGSTYGNDMLHWNKFSAFTPELLKLSSFQGFREDGTNDQMFDQLKRSRIALKETLADSQYMFMRWKETSFVNVSSPDCGLTIDGFYYIVYDRTNGRIEGLYADPKSRPFQRLELFSVHSQSKCGKFYSSFHFA